MTVHWHDDECGYCPCDEPTVTVEGNTIWRTPEDGKREQIGTLARDGVDWFAHGGTEFSLRPTRDEAVLGLLERLRIPAGEYRNHHP